MEISILLMEQIAELFLMILMGYIIVKTGLLKGEDSKVISKIVLYLVIPCVIINAFQVDYTSEKVKELLLVFAASVLLQVILLAAVWGAGKVLKLNEVETTSIYYSNSGNLIVPLVTFILGKEWVLYGCVFMSVQLVFLWTHGKNTISREGKWDWKKIVFNDFGICRSCIILYKDQTAGNRRSGIEFCGQYDRSGEYDRNGNADRRDES